MNISKAQIDAFKKDGAIQIRGLVDKEWLPKLAAAIENDILDPGPLFHNYQVERGSFHGNSVCWIRHPQFADYVSNSALPATAAQLLGSKKVNLLYDQLFVKEAGTNAKTPWHHDHCVWPLSGRQVVSFWLALDKVDATNGRVEFIRGSHLWDGLFQPESFSKSAIAHQVDPRFKKMPDIDTNRSQYDIVTWDLEPGDVVAFWSRTVHGAGGNLSEGSRRRGYTVRYCGDDVRYSTALPFVKMLRNPDLSDGDSLDSLMFPIVWREGPVDIETPPDLTRFIPATA